jgi:hypothetical protein
MTSYQQSPGRALDYPMSSSVPISGLSWDGRADDHLRFQALKIKHVPHRHHAPISVRQFQPLWRGLRNGLLIELAVGLAILAVVLA